MTGLIDPEVAMAPLAPAEKSQLKRGRRGPESSTREIFARSWGHVPIRQRLRDGIDQIPDQSHDEIRLFGPCHGRRAGGGKDKPSVFNSSNEF